MWGRIYYSQFMTELSKDKMPLETSANMPEEKMEQSSPPKRLLLDFDLSAEEALEIVKAHFGVGQK